MARRLKISVNTEIAVTYLWARKRQTVIASLGVMFGISMFIFMQSLMKGTNDYFEKNSFSNTAHIRIYCEDKIADNHLLNSAFPDSSLKLLTNPKQVQQSLGLTNPYGLIHSLWKDPQITGLTPQVTANVLYTSGSIQLNGNVVGVNINEEDKMFDLLQSLLVGKLILLLRMMTFLAELKKMKAARLYLQRL